ncbi:hydrogenase maturation protease [Candidatus Bathyarchaeota archaeon]|nr:hydrogenase maturation protease [Candidatus Bathyarchaeota archaeon]
MKILVAGVGNLLKCDDGLGPHVIERLKEVRLPPNVEVMDLGTSGMDILHYSADYDKIIFIDAVRLGKPPGTVYRMKPRQVQIADDEIRDMVYMSMHEVDLERVIAIGRRLRQMPENLVIIGCEPKETSRIGIGLTEEVNSTVPRIIRLILEEIEC